MATRSLIIRKNEDKFDVIYHHWDGYIDGGLGYFLNKNFNNKENVDWLFSLKKDFSSILGSVKKSQIGKKNSNTKDYSLSMYNESKNKIEIPSSIINDQKNINYVVYYDEKNNCFDMDWKDVLESEQQYNYIFDGEWFVVSSLSNFKDYDKNNFVKLSDALNFYQIFNIREELFKDDLNESDIIDAVIKKVKSVKKLKNFYNFLNESKSLDFFKYWEKETLIDLKNFSELVNNKILNKKISKKLKKEICVAKENKKFKM